METRLNQVFFPVNYSDLFSTWNRFPDAVPYAGGTDLIGCQGNNIIKLPKLVLCLDKIEELRRITRTEQYLEIGAMVKLNQLFKLGKIVPVILYRCIEQIAGCQLRNIATVGGNVCSASALFDLPAVFCALDAQYELRSASSARWIAASRFHAKDDKKEKNSKGTKKEQELLTRIRLPLIAWDYSIYKKFLTNSSFLWNNRAAVLIFLAKAQKTILTELRIVFKSDIIIRNRNSEDALLGKNLPISRKSALEFVASWKDFLDNREDISEFCKNAILHNIEENVFILSE